MPGGNPETEPNPEELHQRVVAASDSSEVPASFSSAGAEESPPSPFGALNPQDYKKEETATPEPPETEASREGSPPLEDNTQKNYLENNRHAIRDILNLKPELEAARQQDRYRETAENYLEIINNNEQRYNYNKSALSGELTSEQRSEISRGIDANTEYLRALALEIEQFLIDLGNSTETSQPPAEPAETPKFEPAEVPPVTMTSAEKSSQPTPETPKAEPANQPEAQESEPETVEQAQERLAQLNSELKALLREVQKVLLKNTEAVKASIRLVSPKRKEVDKAKKDSEAFSIAAQWTKYADSIATWKPESVKIEKVKSVIGTIDILIHQAKLYLESNLAKTEPAPVTAPSSVAPVSSELPPVSAKSPSPEPPAGPPATQETNQQEPLINMDRVTEQGDHFLAGHIYGEGINVKSGDQVTIVRSDGTREDDWFFLFAEGEKDKSPTTITVRKKTSEGKELLKHVDIKDFLSWQEKIPVSAPTGSEAPPIATPTPTEHETRQEPSLPDEVEDDEFDFEQLSPKQLLKEAQRQGWESYANDIIKLEQSTNEFIARYTLRYKRISAESAAGILGFYEKATKKKESLFGKINERLGNLQTQAELALKKKEGYEQSLKSISEGLSAIDETLDDLEGVDLSRKGRQQIDIAIANRAALVEAFEKKEGQLMGYTALIDAYKHSIKRIAYYSGIQVKNEALGVGEEIKKEDLSRDTEGNITTWLHEYDDAIDGIGQHVISETGERGYTYGSRAETAKRSRRSLLEALFNFILGISKPAAEGGKI